MPEDLGGIIVAGGARIANLPEPGVPDVQAGQFALVGRPDLGHVSLAAVVSGGGEPEEGGSGQIGIGPQVVELVLPALGPAGNVDGGFFPEPDRHPGLKQPPETAGVQLHDAVAPAAVSQDVLDTRLPVADGRKHMRLHIHGPGRQGKDGPVEPGPL